MSLHDIRDARDVSRCISETNGCACVALNVKTWLRALGRYAVSCTNPESQDRGSCGYTKASGHSIKAIRFSRCIG